MEQREAFWREAISRGDPELWVAEDAGEIIGWAAFGPSRDGDAGEKAGELHALYVVSSRWGSGVGRELWLTARRRLLERGFRAVTLWVLTGNERAMRFYRAAGFVEETASKKAVTIGGEALQEIRLRISLA